MNSLKIPNQILLGSDMSIIGFPQCGNSYYLLMQLDKEFKPVFHLLEAQLVPPAERRNSVTDVKSIIRVGEIDVGQMPVTQEDLYTTSLIKWEKIQMMLQNNLTTSNQIIDNGLEPILQLPGGFGGSRSTFSSIVDEVFESEKSNANIPGSFPSQSHLSTGYGYSPGLIGSSPGNYLQSPNSFLASSPSRSLSVRKVGPSKSDQDLRSLHSPDVRQSSAIAGSLTSGRKTTPAVQQPCNFNLQFLKYDTLLTIYHYFKFQTRNCKPNKNLLDNSYSGTRTPSFCILVVCRAITRECKLPLHLCT